MKDSHFGYAVFIITVALAALFLFTACSPAPCWCLNADGEYESIVEDKEKPQVQTLLGSHDFFLEGEE